MRFVKSLMKRACVRHSLVWCFVKKLIKQQEKMGKRVQKMYFFAHFFMPGVERKWDGWRSNRQKRYWRCAVVELGTVPLAQWWDWAVILSGTSARAEGLRDMGRCYVRMCISKSNREKHAFIVVRTWSSRPQGGGESSAQTVAGGNGGNCIRRKWNVRRLLSTIWPAVIVGKGL